MTSFNDSLIDSLAGELCNSDVLANAGPYDNSHYRNRASRILEIIRQHTAAPDVVALAMLNAGRERDGHPTVASFDGFDDETKAFWIMNAKAAIAAMGGAGSDSSSPGLKGEITENGLNEPTPPANTSEISDVDEHALQMAWTGKLYPAGWTILDLKYAIKTYLNHSPKPVSNVVTSDSCLKHGCGVTRKICEAGREAMREAFQQPDDRTCKSCDGVGWFVGANYHTGEAEQVQCQECADQVVQEVIPCPYINGWTADNHGVSYILKRYEHYSDFVLFDNGKPHRCFRFTESPKREIVDDKEYWVAECVRLKNELDYMTRATGLIELLQKTREYYVKQPENAAEQTHLYDTISDNECHEIAKAHTRSHGDGHYTFGSVNDLRRFIRAVWLYVHTPVITQIEDGATHA